MCSLFGLIDYKGSLSARQKKIIKGLSAECEVKDTNTTEIAYVEIDEIKIYKQPLPAHKIKFKFKSNPSVIMGYTQMTKQDNQKFNYNNHLFYFKKLKFALAYNGIIHNDKNLENHKNSPKLIYKQIRISLYSLLKIKESLTLKRWNLWLKIKRYFSQPI